MKVIFLGTPDFAVPTLKAIAASRHELAAVIAQPDRAKNRRGELLPTPVHAAAVALGVPFYAFDRLRDETGTLRTLSPDIMVTAAYGQILTQEILDIPSFGVINVHASLLPEYRGSSPIQWAIIDGKRETGVTIMQTERGLDTGDILRVRKTPIGSDETAGQLSDRLAVIGAEEAVKALDDIAAGRAEPVRQDEAKATCCKKLTKADGRLDFTRPADELRNRIRGLNPWPAAYTGWNGAVLKIFSATVVDSGGAPGTVLSADRSGFVVACGDKALKIETLQAPGGRVMTSAQFLAGHPVAAGSRLIAPDGE